MVRDVRVHVVEPSNNSNAVGRTFEQFVAELLEAMGYDLVGQNVDVGGHEEDMVFFEALFNNPIIVECKGGSKPADNSNLLRLWGLLAQRRSLEPEKRWEALLVAAGGFTSSALQDAAAPVPDKPRLMGPDEIVNQAVRHRVIADPEALTKELESHIEDAAVTFDALLVVEERRYLLFTATTPAARQRVVLTAHGSPVPPNDRLFTELGPRLEALLGDPIAEFVNVGAPGRLAAVGRPDKGARPAERTFSSLEDYYATSPELYRASQAVMTAWSDHEPRIMAWRAQIEGPLISLLRIYSNTVSIASVPDTAEAVAFLHHYLGCLAEAEASGIDGPVAAHEDRLPSLLRTCARVAATVKKNVPADVSAMAAEHPSHWVPTALVMLLSDLAAGCSRPALGERLMGVQPSMMFPTVMPDAVMDNIRFSLRRDEQILDVSGRADTDATYVALTRIVHAAERRSETLAQLLMVLGERWPVLAITGNFDAAAVGQMAVRFTLVPERVIELLMGRELYNDRDAWLRELVQNAVDACVLRRSLADDDYEPVVRVEVEDGAVVIADNGVGMTREHLVNYLSRVGETFWSSSEVRRLLGGDAEGFRSFGQFGIGFVSVFQVAAAVEVTTRHVHQAAAWRWRATGPAEPVFLDAAEPIDVGTRIRVRFREDYDLDLGEAMAKFFAYEPAGVPIDGPELAPLPKSFDDMSPVPPPKGNGDFKGWQFGEALHRTADYSVKVAVPIPEVTDPDRRKLPGTRIVVLNDGIVVEERSTTWLADWEYDWSRPSIGLSPLYVAVNFARGRAPVTLSRREVVIDEELAEEIHRVAADLVVTVWSEHLERAGKVRPAARRSRFLRVVQSTFPAYTYGRTHLAFLKASAAELFRTHCPVRLVDMVTGEKSMVPVDDARLQALDPVLVALPHVADAPAFSALLERHGQTSYIEVATQWEADIASRAIGKRAGSYDEKAVLAALSVDELDCALSTVVPGDCAVVSGRYFRPHIACYRLPRSAGMPPADVAATRRRSEARASYSARFLLNGDHPFWQEIDSFVQHCGDNVPAEVTLLIDRLITGVADEKRVGRRKGAMQAVMSGLSALVGPRLPHLSESAFGGG